MKRYLAIGIPQWPDQSLKEKKIEFFAEDDKKARIKVQNTMDMSYIWDIIDVTPKQK